MSLSACRVCESANVRLHSSFEQVPIHMWPLARPDGASHPHRQEPIDLYACLACGHTQLQEMSESLVAELYGEGFPYEDDRALKLNRLGKITGVLGDGFFRGKKVLDVGGGNNPFTGLIPDSERWIADIDESARKLVGVSADHAVIGDFGRADLPKHYFDVVTGFHVMEHFRWPLEAVRKMSEVVAPGGRVIIEVPHFSRVIEEKPWYGVFHQHQSMFTESSLSRLFSEGGFEIEKWIRNDEVLLAVYRKSEAKPAAIAPVNGMAILDRFRDRLRGLESQLKNSAFYRSSDRLGIYGAGGTTMLILAHFPFLRERVKRAFDRETQKQGKFIPGSAISVAAPEELGRATDLQGMVFVSENLRQAMGPSFPGESINLASMLDAASDQPNFATV